MKGMVICAAATLSIMTAAPAFPQSGSGSSECMVEEAAQAALDREIALIKDLAANVDDTFNGPEGCIDSSIFQEFDLSVAIPDLAGFITSASTDLITNAISAARDKACQAINDKIANTVGTAQGTISNFSSGLTGDMQNVLDNGWGDLSL